MGRHDDCFSIYDTPFIMNEFWVRFIYKIVINEVISYWSSYRSSVCCAANFGLVTGPIRNYLINNIIFLHFFLWTCIGHRFEAWVFLIPLLLLEGVCSYNKMSVLFNNRYECRAFLDGINPLSANYTQI